MAPKGRRGSGRIGRSCEGDLRGKEFIEDKRTVGWHVWRSCRTWSRSEWWWERPAWIFERKAVTQRRRWQNGDKELTTLSSWWILRSFTVTAALGVSRKTKPFDKVFEEFSRDAQRLMEVLPRGGELLHCLWGIRNGCSVSPTKVRFQPRQEARLGWEVVFRSTAKKKKKCGRIGAWVSNHRKGWLGPWGTTHEVRLRGMIGGSSPPGVWENPVLFSGTIWGVFCWTLNNAVQISSLEWPSFSWVTIASKGGGESL